MGITTYAFGLEEHSYDGSGNNTGNTYYYNLGGRLIGQFDGTNTQFDLTDELGSVLAAFNNTPGIASVLANQAYGPYGNKLYSAGTMGTNKGYTGQYSDPTGLDYYNARYYDPVVGRFVSADIVQGNSKGMDPYNYVGSNPETNNDPTGNCFTAIFGICIDLPGIITRLEPAPAPPILGYPKAEPLPILKVQAEDPGSDSKASGNDQSQEKPEITSIDQLDKNQKTPVKELLSDTYRNEFDSKDDTQPKPDPFALKGNEVTKNGMVRSGLSHFLDMVEIPKRETIRYHGIDSGTRAPDGLVWEYRWQAKLNAWHIGLEPENGPGSMTEEEYNNAFNTIKGKYEYMG